MCSIIIATECASFGRLLYGERAGHTATTYPSVSVLALAQKMNQAALSFSNRPPSRATFHAYTAYFSFLCAAWPKTHMRCDSVTMCVCVYKYMGSSVAISWKMTIKCASPHALQSHLTVPYMLRSFEVPYAHTAMPTSRVGIRPLCLP